MEHRLSQLELSVNRHDDQIAKLFAQVSDMNKHLTSIQDTLNQIKYIGIGMIIYFTLQEFGFFAAFKVVSKVAA
jgi:hypothetical protein